MSPAPRRPSRLAALVVALASAVRGHRLSRPSFLPSDHWDGRRFLNPNGRKPRGFGDLLRWQLTRRAPAWPDRVEVVSRPELPTSLGPNECAVTFVNHATFLIQLPGLNVLTDPVWSERVSPFLFAGPRRVHAPGIAFADLPAIDLVLVSHNHYDHLDLATLRRLRATHRPLVVTMLGNRSFLARAGLPDAVELDWWQSHEVRPGAKVTATPAQHFAARGLFDRCETLWGGFVLEAPAGRLWFAGDSGYCDGFREIGRRLGPFDLGFIPIGAYEPRWFMEPMHCSPTEALRIHREVGSHRSLAMHFGCFPLADDGCDQAVREFTAARSEAGIDEVEFVVPQVGATRRYRFGPAAVSPIG